MRLFVTAWIWFVLEIPIETFYNINMINNNLKQHGEDELSFWVNNDEFLNEAFQESVRRGNMEYIKQALEQAGFAYTDEQWQVLVDDFEDELEEDEDDDCDGEGVCLSDFDDEEYEEIDMDEEAMFEEEEEDDRIDEWMAGRGH
jgi:hypothetical protein